MSGYLEYMVFNLAPDHALRDSVQLIGVTYQIIKGNLFKAIKPSASGEYPPRQFVETTYEAVVQAWYEEMNKGEYGATLDFWSASEDFGFSLSVPFIHYRQIYVTVRSTYIFSPITSKRMRPLIDVCKLIYEMLHPEYGYGLVNPEHLTNPDVKPQAIYDYNFLGPQLVQEIGRETVLKISAWQSFEFSDGGVFFEMTPRTLDKREKLYTPNYEKAAKVLGFETYYQLGIEKKLNKL